jgi:hypothetical protein
MDDGNLSESISEEMHEEKNPQVILALMPMMARVPS